jgi:hypothetical protein
MCYALDRAVTGIGNKLNIEHPYFYLSRFRILFDHEYTFQAPCGVTNSTVVMLGKEALLSLFCLKVYMVIQRASEN